MHPHASRRLFNERGYATTTQAEIAAALGAGPVEEVIARFQAPVRSGIDYVRVLPGSRDTPHEVGARSILGLSEVVRKLATSG